jgi:RecA/RadA recombinase
LKGSDYNERNIARVRVERLGQASASPVRRMRYLRKVTPSSMVPYIVMALAPALGGGLPP